METVISKYAPVLIGTLNRYAHFRRCLESLEKCTGAEFTDVFVALDYPPSIKYEEGWRLIDAYLKEKEKNHSFRALNVIRREYNYGVFHENGNFEVLVKDVIKVYDRYILTEDDNEFSPCFLQYMNKALEKFYGDDRIFLVCGYNYQMEFPEMYRNNFYITKWGCPWGTGQWVHKDNEMNRYINNEVLLKTLKDDDSFLLLKKRNPHVVLSIVSMLKKGALWGDAIKGLYCTLHDKYCVMPCKSLVRNWGNDGTGEHSKKINKKKELFYSQQDISDSLDFEFTDDIFTYEPVYLDRKHFSEGFSIKHLYKMIALFFDVFLLRHFGIISKCKFI